MESNLLGFAAVALAMVVTPGPNMVYLISRSISQGPIAGLISLFGVGAAFVVYMLCAALGITAVLMAIPFAYDTLRAAGALYLLYLAWQAVKPGGRSPLEVKNLPRDSAGKLFTMGFMTNFLNPKAAVLYLSLLPQFILPNQGSVLFQSLALGATQIVISLAVNAIIVAFAGAFASFLQRRPFWLLVQRWVMGTVLAALAVRLALDSRR